MPLRIPKHTVIVTRPKLNAAGEQMFKKVDGEAVALVERITALPGEVFKFTAQEIAEIEASHGAKVLERAFGVIPDSQDPEALPEGPQEGSKVGSDEIKTAASADKDDDKLPGDDDL